MVPLLILYWILFGFARYLKTSAFIFISWPLYIEIIRVLFTSHEWTTQCLSTGHDSPPHVDKNANQGFEHTSPGFDTMFNNQKHQKIELLVNDRRMYISKGLDTSLSILNTFRSIVILWANTSSSREYNSSFNFFN